MIAGVRFRPGLVVVESTNVERIVETVMYPAGSCVFELHEHPQRLDYVNLHVHVLGSGVIATHKLAPKLAAEFEAGLVDALVWRSS